MELNFTVQGVSLLTTLVVNILCVVFFAGKFISKLESIDLSLNRIDKELEKRDTQISALWKRVDELRDMIKT